MAKYHELCDAWAEAVAAASNSKKACDDFARAIANGLENFLEAPAHRVVYLPFENAEKQMGQFSETLESLTRRRVITASA